MILNSEGFTDAKDLASKIVSMFTLSKQLLSRQQHYDWGLRALKAVLNTGGKLIQVPGSFMCPLRGGPPTAVQVELEQVTPICFLNDSYTRAPLHGCLPSKHQDLVVYHLCMFRTHRQTS